GVFSIQQDFDTKYVLVPISFARELFEYTSEITSVEIALAENADVESIQDLIKQNLGPQYLVKNRFQQQETLYRIMQSEKWAIFLILSFILLIATFNVIGSLSMLILDKKKDIAILHSLGADNRLIRKIFMTEGLLVSLSGALAGIVLGTIICLLQQYFGLIKINAEGGSFLISAYPVLMKWTDFLFVFITVSLIGLLAAWIPVRSIGRVDSGLAAMHSR
ncbi:MAG: ABC transporter permease, partial [Lentimicrobium sp.]|nr:ABC transporter permease [Lentimicrobium sp.]